MQFVFQLGKLILDGLVQRFWGYFITCKQNSYFNESKDLYYLKPIANRGLQIANIRFK